MIPHAIYQRRFRFYFSRLADIDIEAEIYFDGAYFGLAHFITQIHARITGNDMGRPYTQADIGQASSRRDKLADFATLLYASHNAARRLPRRLAIISGMISRRALGTYLADVDRLFKAAAL